MAESRTFVCNVCYKSIEAWSDGNPYYIGDTGKKCYAYHPDHENLEKCIGNHMPHICLSCGSKFKVDSRAPISECRKCKSKNIADTFDLSGAKCPYCNKGIFFIDPEKRKKS